MNPPTPIIQRWQRINRALGLPLLPQERLMLISMVQHVRTSGKQAGRTWVKIDALAEELGIDRRTVRRYLDALERAGEIQRWRMPRGYLYRLPLLWDEVVVSAPVVRMQKPTSARRENV